MNNQKTDKKAKKIILRPLFYCILLISSVVFSGCASSMKNEEARAILSDLVPKSQEVNEILWGEGLPLADESNGALATVKGAQYRPVASDCGYTSVDQIKELASSVYSADYLKQVYATAFGEYETDEKDKTEAETGESTAESLGLNRLYARYIEEKGVLYENITYTKYALSTVIYPETAVVVDEGIGLIVCRVDCLIGGEKNTMKITLREQDGCWLLDSPTY